MEFLFVGKSRGDGHGQIDEGRRHDDEGRMGRPMGGSRFRVGGNGRTSADGRLPSLPRQPTTTDGQRPARALQVLWGGGAWAPASTRSTPEPNAIHAQKGLAQISLFTFRCASQYRVLCIVCSTSTEGVRRSYPAQRHRGKDVRLRTRPHTKCTVNTPPSPANRTSVGINSPVSCIPLFPHPFPVRRRV